mgnify:FL=1
MEINEKTTKGQVLDILADLALTKPTQEMTLLGDLQLDSLRLVMLLVTLEDTFAIELDESDMDPFALVTVQDVIDLAQKYTGEVKDDG